MALLEETLDQVVRLELLQIDTQDVGFLYKEMKMLKTRVMDEMPKLIRERQQFSAWQCEKCGVVAEKVSSKKLKTFFEKLGKSLTLGQLCLQSKEQILMGDGVGERTFEECEKWIGETLPKISPVVIMAFYTRDSIEIPRNSILGRMMPEIFRLRH